jgi:HSP20 family protein
MAIRRSDPRRDLMELQDRMKRLFDDALNRSGGVDADAAGDGSWRPPMDLLEEAERYVLRADLPGVSGPEVEVLIEDGALVLRGERRRDADATPESYLRLERPHGRFVARVALPTSVDSGGIRATHANGVIEIVLPKRKDVAPGRIEVSSR